MPIIWRIFFLTIVATSLLYVGWILFYPKPAPRTQWEALDRVTVLREDGRYDEAVRTLQTWMQNDRRDVSRDGLLYQQIAMVYFIKAYKRPEAREDSVHQAALNFDKALRLHHQEQSDGIGADLFEIGGGYALLGDLSTAEKCDFYEKARLSFEQQWPLIQSDTYTAFGKTYPLASLRVEVKKHLDSVRQKLSSSGCPANEKQ